MNECHSQSEVNESATEETLYFSRRALVAEMNESETRKTRNESRKTRWMRTKECCRCSRGGEIGSCLADARNLDCLVQAIGCFVHKRHSGFQNEWRGPDANHWMGLVEDRNERLGRLAADQKR